MLTHILSVILIVLGNTADYLSTRYALRRGGKELNPLIRRLGLLPVKLVGTAVLCVFSVFMPAVYALVYGLILFSAFCALSASNLHQVLKHD
jgi:hypothetical protein